MSKSNQKNLLQVSESEGFHYELEIHDYRTPNKHYYYLKNQVVSSKHNNTNESHASRHSLQDEFNIGLSYL